MIMVMRGKYDGWHWWRTSDDEWKTNLKSFLSQVVAKAVAGVLRWRVAEVTTSRESDDVNMSRR